MLVNRAKLSLPTKKAKKGFSHESKKNVSVDWYTPPSIFDLLGLEFDLDPCHPAVRLPWIPVKHTYSLPQDGNKLPWFGKVWLNPPYGKETPEWLKTMDQHRNGVALLFNRTDCGWFHDYCANADGLLLLKGRVRFVDGLGVTANNGAGTGSMLVSWGQECTEALRRIPLSKGKFYS